MSLKNVTTAEKLAVIDRLIIEERGSTGHRNEALKAIAADLRARLDGAPTVALVNLEHRLNVALNSKTARGYDYGQMFNLAQELLCHWPTIKQAMERFGAEVSA